MREVGVPPKDLEQVVLIEKDGIPVLLRDVAVIEEQAVPRQGAVLRDGLGETVCGMAIMLKGENSRNVIQRIKERLAAFPLPADVSLVPFYDQSDVIESTIATVRKNLLEAGLLVTVVLLLFLVKSARLISVRNPGGDAVWLRDGGVGVSANLMSLGAVDFGMIVDGAVVMMENAMRHLGKNQSEASRLETIRLAAREVARPIVFGVVIIIAVYLPVFFLEDLEGRMFRPMAITVVSALIGSLVLAIFVVPVLASFVLRGKVEEHGSAWFEKVVHGYSRSLEWALVHPRSVIGAAVVTLSVALGSMAYIGTEFMPRLDRLD
jgi:cobalt-zinc-cadmium resistance protein CzcA